MLKSNLLFLFIIVSGLTIAQTNDIIVTYAQNDRWIDLFEKSSHAEKVGLVKQRLINDTAVYYSGMLIPTGIMQDKMIHIPQNYVADLTINDLANDSFQINGFKGDGRLSYLINYSKKGKAHESIFFKRDSTTLVDDVINISNLLNPENVEKITIIKNDEDMIHIFGNSTFGALIIVLNDKKTFKEIYKIIEQDTWYQNGP